MDSFPEDFNRVVCTEALKSKQDELIKDVRTSLYSKFCDDLNKCVKNISLEFPDNLWDSNKLKLTGELIERFGQVKVITINGDIKMTKLTTDIQQIPKNIKRVIIEF